MAVVPKKLSFQLRFRNKTKTRKIFSRNFRLQGLLKKDSNNSSRFYNPFVKKDKKYLLKNPLMALFLKTRSPGNIKFIKKTRVDNNDLKDNLLYLGLSKTGHLEVKKQRAFIFYPAIKEKAKCLLFTSVTTKTRISSHFYREKKSNNNLVRQFYPPLKNLRFFYLLDQGIKTNQYLYIKKKKPFFKPSWKTNRIEINNMAGMASKISLNKQLLTEGQINYNVLESQKFLSTGCLSNKNKFLDNVLRSNYIFLEKKGIVLSRPRANLLLYGHYGICFKQYSIISSKCAETALLDIAKILRKKGRFWIRICCDTPISARPAETRMGKGKGSISYWAAKVNPGQLFFEFSRISLVQLKEIYQKLCKKSAVSLKLVY
jgi:large subunit ribosomal protein L16